MVWIIIAAVGAVIGFGILMYRAFEECWEGLGLLSVLGIITASIVLVVAAIVGFSSFGAEYKAKIVNTEYGTNYTADEIFWASDVIDKIQQIRRQRIEINGDLFRDKK